MTRFHAPHPAEEQLLRFVDGELPPKQAAAVRGHLEACWNCRTQLEEFQKGIGDFVRCHEAYKAGLPAPPRPWTDLRRGMEVEDRALANAPARRVPRSWLSAAAAVLLGVLAFYRFGVTPAASAAELLQKAVAVRRSDTGEARHIRVRTRARSFVRPAVYMHDAGAAQDSVGALFASANYSWEAPLSARSYASWRDQLSEKRDEVETLRDGAANLYRIRTTTQAGSLAEATITLRAQDLAPVSGTFQFRGSEWVEITEAPAPAPEPEPAAPPREVAHAIPVAVPPALGPGVELQAIAALHRIGADLGEPIELTRGERALIVTGTGIDPQRQEQVKASLARVPQVQLRFQEPHAMQESAAGAPVSVAMPLAAHGAELEKAAGGRVAFEKFSNRALDLSEAAMARAHALRNLARRFPASEEARFSQSDLDVLAALRREHAQALAASAAELAGIMNPALAALGASSAPEDVALPANWQDATGQIFTAAQQADQLLNVLLAGANTSLPPDQVPQQLATALRRFQVLSAAYRDEGRR
jgi:anti-sigma factor RsiW